MIEMDRARGEGGPFGAQVRARGLHSPTGSARLRRDRPEHR